MLTASFKTLLYVIYHRRFKMYVKVICVKAIYMKAISEGDMGAGALYSNVGGMVLSRY